ncbi:MAG: DUF72 domain-containing protein [Verrucomicrobiaceae bacterium]|nr:MAG: DUF72 domain-containing protein [Verrucomicrobiaceae bacterium]
MRTWIGTSGFQYPEWKGGFYPADLSVAKMLGYYSGRFSTTEINYTFRQIPKEATVKKWVDGTPEDFRFTFKAPQKVSHFARLRNCGETMRYFHQVMLGLGEKRGAVLLQLPPDFTMDYEVLESFLKELPEGMRVAFEFRHESWFDGEVYALLKKHNAALCLAESADLVTPRKVTADFGYLRLRREDYSDADLEDWAVFVKKQKRKWGEVYVYFKHEEKGVGPVFAEKFKGMVG